MTARPKRVDGIIDGLLDLATPTADLDTLKDNPRRGDVSAVARSLERFGQRKPVVVTTDGTVIAGNHTFLAARMLGWTHVAAVAVTDDDVTAKAYSLADNRTAELGGYDSVDLAAMVADVGSVDAGLVADTGWTAEALDEIIAEAAASVRDEVAGYNDDPTTDDYYTPAWVFEKLGLEFDLDVASPLVAPEWIPAKRRYTIEDDGLVSPWEGLVWMNPPYSGPGPWVEKFMDHGNGVALLPFGNSKWWRSVWVSDLPISVPPDTAIKFVGGGIPLPVFFVAAGDQAQAALPNVGVVRHRA